MWLPLFRSKLALSCKMLIWFKINDRLLWRIGIIIYNTHTNNKEHACMRNIKGVGREVTLFRALCTYKRVLGQKSK